MKTQSLVAIFIVGMAFTACNQNPYSVTNGGTIYPTKPEQHYVPSPYSIEGTDLICFEGKECKTTLIGHVPSPGNALLTVTNLPAGATFDPATGILSYTPGYDVADVTNTPVLLPAINVQITSDISSVITNNKTLAVTVNNTMQPLTINYVSGPVAVAEGESLDQVINLTSADFPNGPYYLALDGAPTGTSVTPVPGTMGQFKVHFTADTNFVTVADTATPTGYAKTFTVTYVGSTGTAPVLFKKDWTISDKRTPAQIVSQDAITQGLDVNFSIAAEDLNGEVAPLITVDPAQVPFGKLTVTTGQQTCLKGLPCSSANVRWTGLTAANVGKTVPIKFIVCVLSAPTVFGTCTVKTTSVTLSATPQANTFAQDLK